MSHTQIHHTDTLVLGSGLAGLYFALQVADRRKVTILTKHQSESSNTRWAQGGISAVFAPEDSLDAHVKDTLEVGAGLCREDMVRRAVELGPKLVASLANDFGERLGCGGYLSSLCRTRIGEFRLSEAQSIEQLEAEIRGAARTDT